MIHIFANTEQNMLFYKDISQKNIRIIEVKNIVIKSCVANWLVFTDLK
jgi:hypothetical protein